MSAKRGEARKRILECAISLMKEAGVDAFSIEAVASAAGSAKGLVHYHFKTRQGLLSAVASEITTVRSENWRAAFEAPSASEAVSRTWSLLTEESGDGTVRAWQSLVGAPERLTDGLAKKLRDDFAGRLSEVFTSMLRNELGLAPTIPDSEIGLLLETVVDGMGFQLAGGTEESELEGAYSAAWLAILSLAHPAT